jgi:hypothetical protein
MELLISIAITLLIAEVYVWLPRLSDWLVDRAVLRLADEMQDRYREEWKSHLHSLPNSIVRLVEALSLLGPHTANDINDAHFSARTREFDGALDTLANQHDALAQKIRSLVVKATMNRETIVGLEQTVRAHERNLRALEWPDPIRQAPNFPDIQTAVLKATDEFDRFGHAVVRAITRATTITTAAVGRLNGRVDENEWHLLAIRAKRAHLQDVLRKRKPSAVAASAALTDLDQELGLFREKIKDAGIDNDDPAGEEEYKRIMIALNTAISLGQNVATKAAVDPTPAA